MSCCKCWGKRNKARDIQSAVHTPQPDTIVCTQIPTTFNHYSRQSGVINGQNCSPQKFRQDTQHIADREPADEGSDPTVDVKKDAKFVEEKNRGQSWYFDLVKRMKRDKLLQLNSSNEMYLDGSTVCKPDSRATIRAVAIAICLLIRSPDESTETNHEEFRIFSETEHPMKIDQSLDEDPTQTPSLRTVHRFIRVIFQNAQLSPECAIITMVYLERLLYSSGLSLTVNNWKRILLCAILLASKVWDDQAVWNVDYCQILEELRVDDVNELERRYLEIIQFNINVRSSIYTKYYFDIRDLTVTTHVFDRLSVATAKELEACSRNLLDWNLGVSSSSATPCRLRRAASIDSFFAVTRPRPFILP